MATGFKEQNYKNFRWKTVYPAKKLTVEQVMTAARARLTKEEAAAVFGMHLTTLNKCFERKPELAEAWDRGNQLFKASLRRLQFRHAQMPSSAGVQMTIHLSKFVFGEHDPAANVNIGQLNVIGQLLNEIDGTSRGIPAANQVVDVTPAPEIAGPNTLPDKSPFAFGNGKLKNGNGSGGNGHGEPT